MLELEKLSNCMLHSVSLMSDTRVVCFT